MENTGLVSGDDVLFSAGDAFAVALSHSGTVVAKQSARLYSDGGSIEVAGAISAPGGRVEIGGTDHGGAGAPRALETSVTESASIDVSAEAADQRGHVVVGADDLTTFRGSIRGKGIAGGDGAFVEISAAQVDMGDGQWDISLGQGGELLFDPVNITIDGPMAGSLRSQLHVGTSITVDTDAGPWGGAGTDAGDISVVFPIEVSGSAHSARLTLNAARDILINENVVNSQTVVGGNVFSLNAGRDIRLNAFLQTGISSNSTIVLNANGSITVGTNGNIDTGRGGLSMTAGTDIVLQGSSQIYVGVGPSINNFARFSAPNGTMHFAGGRLVLYGNTDATIVAKRFINETGETAITTSGVMGQWQIALPHPYGETFETNPHLYGNLKSGNHAVFNSTGTADPQRKEYHYAFQPEIRVEAADADKTYGESGFSVGHTFWNADFVDAATYGDVFTQDTYMSSITGTLSKSSAGASSTANVGTYDIVPSGLSSTNGYGFNYINGTLTVNPRPVTLSASQQEKYYGQSIGLSDQAFTILDYDGDGLLPNGELIDTVNIESLTGIDASTTSMAGTYGNNLRISDPSGSAGFDEANYAFTYVNAPLVITPRPITLTAQTQRKDYGDTLNLSNTAFYIIDLNGGGALPNGEQVNTVSLLSQTGAATSTTHNVGTYTDEIQITGQSGSEGFFTVNYDISYVNGDLVVDPRAITVAASQQQKVYGDALTLETTAFTVLDKDGDALLPNGEKIDRLVLQSATGVATDTQRGAGLYDGEIVIAGHQGSGGFEAGNYTFTHVDGRLVVQPRAITLAADSWSRVYGDVITFDGNAFTLTDLTGGSTLPNGESVTSVLIDSAAGNAGTALVGSYTGDLVITSQTGANGFEAANYAITYEAGNLTITPRPITFVAHDQERLFYGPAAPDPSAFTMIDADGDASLPNGEQIDLVTISSAGGVATRLSASPGIYEDNLVVTGQVGSNGFNADNYLVSYLPGDLAIRGVNAPWTLAETFGGLSATDAGTDLVHQLSTPPAFDLSLSLLPLYGDPKWNALGESQRTWFLREFDRWSVEEIPAPVLQQLLNQALLQ